jgi:hypothetical protein
MQLRSGKIINDKFSGTEFKDKPMKLRPILRNIKKLINIALTHDEKNVYDRLVNVYNVIKYVFTHLYLLCKDVSCNQFLYTVYLKAHELINQIHDLENKNTKPQYNDLSKKITSMSITIIGRLEKLLQFSYK